MSGSAFGNHLRHLPIQPMTRANFKSKSSFKAKLLRPAKPGNCMSWAFILVPKDASEKLPRRGKTSVEGTINNQRFQQTLEPDGQLGHWLPISKELCESAGAAVGDTVSLQIAPLDMEPEPDIPPDFDQALATVREARAVWDATTTVARLDWIHWITSAKQPKTREKRIKDACDMLAGGKRRVCCFDPSGYYSKAFRAPEAAVD